MRAVLVRLLKLLRVLAEALLALLARKRQLVPLLQRVVLLLVVALGAVEPLAACFPFFFPREAGSACQLVSLFVLFFLLFLDFFFPWFGVPGLFSIGGRFGVQHGERIDTWALRMCLLLREVMVSGCNGNGTRFLVWSYHIVNSRERFGVCL